MTCDARVFRKCWPLLKVWARHGQSTAQPQRMRRVRQSDFNRRRIRRDSEARRTRDIRVRQRDGKPPRHPREVAQGGAIQSARQSPRSVIRRRYLRYARPPAKTNWGPQSGPRRAAVVNASARLTTLNGQTASSTSVGARTPYVKCAGWTRTACARLSSPKNEHCGSCFARLVQNPRLDPATSQFLTSKLAFQRNH